MREVTNNIRVLSKDFVVTQQNYTTGETDFYSWATDLYKSIPCIVAIFRIKHLKPQTP